jgi:hypothetical protein
MKYRIILIFSLAILKSGTALSGLSDHLGRVKGACPGATPLLVKKSALELNSPNACHAKFTSQILATCKAIDCHALVQSYKKNIQGRSGSVVGE